MTTSTTHIPGYLAGTWTIDPVHSEIGFSVRHMMVSKVRGKFTEFSGQLVTGEDLASSSATVEIAFASLDTGNAQRDEHVRSADFFDAETHPTMTFRSTGITPKGDGFIVDGELTIKGVTKPLAVTVEPGGFGPDAYGGTRAGFTGTAEINRQDFNVSFNAAMESGGVVVGDKVTINLEIEAVLNS